jgi:hypothetical protein
VLFEIKNQWTGDVLYTAEAAAMKDAVEQAIKTRANLTGADLTRANLSEADLTRANLTRANLTGANLTKADLTRANLTGANLTKANLTGANLTKADLTEADLTRANLTGADLTRANLTKADLTRANLTGADLTRANLTKADLTRADLTKADLSCIREDFQLVLDSAPAEVVGLRLAVTEGRIDGSTYTGDCACLIGTIANVRQSDFYELPGLVPNDDRRAERWFLAIHRGDKPESSQIAAITLGWIDEWIADRREPKPIIDRAPVVADAEADDDDPFPSIH